MTDEGVVAQGAALLARALEAADALSAWMEEHGLMPEDAAEKATDA